MTEPGLDRCTLVRVEWNDPRAVALREAMDVEIGARYADPGATAVDEQVALALVVDPAEIAATLLVLDGDAVPIAHGALRMLRGDWEIKRVIVASAYRGRGVGRALMTELERIAVVGGASRLILQTRDRQPEAVALYERLGYTPIPIYEPYVEAIPFSLCFEKPVAPLCVPRYYVRTKSVRTV